MRKIEAVSVTNAILDQKLMTLTETVNVGFKGVHERQDTTNGKVIKSQEDIVQIKQDLAVKAATARLQGTYEKILWLVITTLVGLVTFFLTKY
jgi:hypothetical protein